MKTRLTSTWLPIALVCALLSISPHNAIAGFDEGLAAYNNSDFATAFDEFRLLAAKSDARAQVLLGTLYKNGQGIAEDVREAVRWFRMAAEKGAQTNLGKLCKSGQGVSPISVVAYELHSPSRLDDLFNERKAANFRAWLAEGVGPQEIEVAGALTRELAKPDNFLKALDQYTHEPASRRKARPSK